MANLSWSHCGEGFFESNRSRDDTDHANKTGGSSNPLLYKGEKCINKMKHWDQKSFISNFEDPDSNSMNNISWSASSDEEGKEGKDGHQNRYSGHRKRKHLKRKASSGIVKDKRPAVKPFISNLTSREENVKCVVTATDKDCTRLKPLIKHESLFAHTSNSVQKVKHASDISSWSVSTFSSVSECGGSTLPSDSNKLKNFKQREGGFKAMRFEEAEIIDCESDSDRDVITEELVKESDVEDIASDHSESSQLLCNTSQRNEASLVPDPIPSEDTIDKSVEIGSLSSSNESGKASERVGASDWAMRFQQGIEVSPERKDEEGSYGPPATKQYDSAKKKQKYSSDSMVGQLVRLIQREKSGTRFWQHLSTRGSAERENSSKSVTLQVISKWKYFHLCVTDCRVLSDTFSLIHSKTCCLIFGKSNVVNQMDLQTGNVLQLFPPWKQLDAGEKITIFCANRVKVIINETDAAVVHHKDTTYFPSDAFIDQAEEVSVKASQLKISYQWDCPCKHDASMQSSQCPAYPSDHNANYFFKMVQSLPKSSSSLPSLSSHHNHHFHSVRSSSIPPPTPSNSSVPLLSSTMHRGLLQSIQEERTMALGCMPPFVVTVLRVFRCQIEAYNSVRLSVLIEDTFGCVALLQLEDEFDLVSHHALWCELSRMENMTCICQNVSMVNRWNKDRDPSLFQVIHHHWRDGRKTNTQESPSQQNEGPRKMPGFCYILQTLAHIKNCLQLQENSCVNRDSQVGGTVISRLSCLNRVMKDGISQRFSCAAKLIDVRESLTKAVGIFVCDPTNTDVSEETTFYPLSMGRDSMSTEQSRNRKSCLCLLQDVFLDDNKISLDKFSSLIWHWEWNDTGMKSLIERERGFFDNIRNHVIKAPPLGHSEMTDLFIQVSGRIIGVDQNNCYSWNGCKECGSSLETVPTSRLLYCPRCKKKIFDAETQMCMEVEILENSCKDYRVKIDLTADTIMTLLPDELPDEGYDMDLVIGKPLLSCLAHVISWDGGTAQLYQVQG